MIILTHEYPAKCPEGKPRWYASVDGIRCTNLLHSQESATYAAQEAISDGELSAIIASQLDTYVKWLENPPTEFHHKEAIREIPRLQAMLEECEAH